MCGIVGVVGLSVTANSQTRLQVQTMGQWQAHRGPDAWGEWLSSHVGFGHNRLAIVDISLGKQPMHSTCGRVTVIFNGEIYNAPTLRQLLEQKGRRFHTHNSDTEVIVNGYLEWGEEVFKHLDGMFAIGLWDRDEKKLLLVRDHIGIKPLYYALIGTTLVFASEVKAVLASGVVPRIFFQDALPEFFLFRAPIGSNTFIKDIKKVLPGQYLSYHVTSGRLTFHTHWSITQTAAAISVKEAVECMEDAIEKSVQRHLLSDVPVGIFLSGGVDSSLLAALASRDMPLQAFTIGVDGELDESGFAKAVSIDLKIPIHVRRVDGKDFFEKLEHWMYYNDDPVSDPSALALMILAEEVHRAGYKVMLAGEGADELFGGYNSYLRFTLFHRLSRWHVSVLAGRVSNLFSFRDADYLENLAQPVFQGTAHISSARLRAEIITGVSAAWNDSSVSAEVQSFTPLRQAMIVDQLIRLPNDLLMRTDRATMAYAVETRVPYLDKKVIAYANAFRDADCARLFSGQSKIWLKQLAATHIAKKNIYRPKMGFDLPIGAWLRGPLRELIRTCLREQKIPGICYENMERLYVIQHQKSNRYTPVIWAWLILEMWYRNWILKKITRPYWPH